jgi:hypothetical protein
MNEQTVDEIIQDLCDIPENNGEDCEERNPGKALCTNLDELTIILRRHILGEE